MIIFLTNVVVSSWVGGIPPLPYNRASNCMCPCVEQARVCTAVEQAPCLHLHRTTTRRPVRHVVILLACWRADEVGHPDQLRKRCCVCGSPPLKRRIADLPTLNWRTGDAQYASWRSFDCDCHGHNSPNDPDSLSQNVLL